MANKTLMIVRESLQDYADRGVFRGFSEVRKGQFSFVWIAGHQMELRLDTSRQLLRFSRLLPDIPLKSELYADLKDFIRQRDNHKLPEHRRIDKKLAEVSCFNRNGFVSISLKVKKGQYQYGVNRIVNLVHEIFLHLRDVYPEYLVENFDVPQE